MWFAVIIFGNNLYQLCRKVGGTVAKVNLALAVVVAVAIKITGILLITAMLIIPAATARPFCKTPEAMAVLATLIGAFSAFVGIQASNIWDTPTGPTIVCVAALLFIFSNVAGLTRQAG